MRRALVGLTLLGSLLIGAAPAAAAQPTVFDESTTPITCQVQNAGPIAGQRFCGSTPGQATPITSVPSFDGTPIDVNVVLPPETANPSDTNWPVILWVHGYGGQKSNFTDVTSVQRWVSRGYAVVSPTARGFWGSCGVKVPNPKPGNCANGYIRLMSQQWEIRDFQYLLGLLADENLIAPTKIGAAGQSYGGGASMQLGALKNRIVLGARMGETNGQTAPWTSPDGTAMSIAATAPEFGWSDLSYALVPNGSFLDYAAFNPYRGPSGDRRIGTQKQAWLNALFNGGAATGFYSSADPRYDIPGIKALLDTGGPYDGVQALQTALDQFSKYHSAAGVDQSVAPAPQLISQGWNDDLFPVSEALRYYNMTREKFPDGAINLFAFDWGHNPRGPSGTVNTDNATALFATEGLWMDHYVKGAGSAPEHAVGGVTLIPSSCSDETSGAALTSGAAVSRDTWAEVAGGEIALASPAVQTVGASTPPANTFQAFGNPVGTTICTTSPAGNTPNAAVYDVPAATGAFTVAGSPTVLADIAVQNANDHVVARLYDVNTAANTERLISRTVYRPVGTGERRAIFQLSPQMWRVADGHRLKLELLSTDAPYVQTPTGQGSYTVKNLTLRVPTLEGPGSAGGAVSAIGDKELPPGYTFARDFAPAATPTPSPTAEPTYAIPTATPTATPGYTVKRKPNITARAKPKRDKKKPFIFRVQGKLTFPSSVSKAAGCKGTVRIVAKKGKKVIAKRRTGIKSTCKYKARVKLRKSAGKRGTAKFKVQYLGSNVLLKDSAKTKAKYGKKKR